MEPPRLLIVSVNLIVCGDLLGFAVLDSIVMFVASVIGSLKSTATFWQLLMMTLQAEVPRMTMTWGSPGVPGGKF